MPAATSNPTSPTPVAEAASDGENRATTPDSGASSSAMSSPSNSEQLNDDCGSHDRINIGSTIRCVYVPPANANANGAGAAAAAKHPTLEGEVVAFEPKKVLVIKSTASNKKKSLNNIHMINISLPIYKIQVLKERTDTLKPLSDFNKDKLSTRLKDQIESKKRSVMAYKQPGVTPEARQLFVTIQKTIDDVYWSGESIVVMKEVKIVPPYLPADVKGITDSQALKHVRKIVEKHIQDQPGQLVEHQPSPSPQPGTADPRESVSEVAQSAASRGKKSRTNQSNAAATGKARKSKRAGPSNSNR